MKRGDIVYDPDFDFLDGGHANKLLVILSDVHKNGYVYIVLATSKGKKKDRDCQPSNKQFFIPSGKEFPKDTWLDLGRAPICILASTLENKISEKKM